MRDLFDLPFEEESQPPADPQPSGARRPLALERTVLSVTQLNVRVRDTLEQGFSDIWVEGELSNCKAWNGHLYFTLKDASSQLRGFMFRSTLRYLKFKPADGLRVVARGRISVYEPKGDYQLVCEHLEPQGLGALQLAFDQLKRQLQSEGLFDASRKRPLPALPRKIGIVTSLDGAAIRDIIKVLSRRYDNVHLVIRPARVQGDGAAADVARGIQAVSRVAGVDVVIVGRGGGSIEDLWAFNEAIVARAIGHCPVPVISAVGHETDTTIADFVADLRAPTPSAAAELVVAAKDQFCRQIDRLHERLRAAARHRLQRFSRRVHGAVGRPSFSGFPARLAMRGRHVADLERQLATFNLGRRIESIRTRLVANRTRLNGAIAGTRHRAERQLSDAAARLDALSPLAVLGRGYAVCWNADRTRVIRDAGTVPPGDRVKVRLATGELDCEVRTARTDV